MLLLSGCVSSRLRHDRQTREYYDLFDTVAVLSQYGDVDAAEFDARCEAAFSVLSDHHRLLDIYHEYPDMVNLCTINRNAGGAPLAVDQRLMDFLLYCRRMYELTDGRTNIAMGAVLSLWHEARLAAADGIGRVPDARAIADAMAHSDMSKLELDEAAGTVRLADPEMSLDVGAIGKGYAVERAAERLCEMGATSFVLNVGGNIRAIGSKPNGTPWRTGVIDPADPSGFAAYLALEDESCVTSGTYERYFVSDGVRYHHLIDSETGYPARLFDSVTVIAEDSGLADALTTALFCMPYETGRALVDSLPDVEAIWIAADGTLSSTDGVRWG